MTVTLTFSPSVSSMLAPKMMFASSCACSCTRLAASWISCILRSGPPTMLMSTPVAPSTEMSSRSGEVTAISAARRARFWPLAMPVPMSARPMLLMTVFTSAKSTLTMPFCVMRSLMPLTAW